MTADVVVVSIEEDGCCGRGECVPYARYGETKESALRQIESVQRLIEAGVGREDLISILGAGAARNAIDCALWDLELKRSGRRLFPARFSDPITTAVTISYGDAKAMGMEAALRADFPLLKIKFGSRHDLDRLKSVRDAAPNSKLIVDANEAWTIQDLEYLAPFLHAEGVMAVEQPLAATHDNQLQAAHYPFSICADESCHTRESLARVHGKYDMINIKLDKTGGLTEAIALRDLARTHGLKIMVGCMVATSLSMAPALVIAAGADFVDLDGPLLLARDREHGLSYDGPNISTPDPRLWG